MGRLLRVMRRGRVGARPQQAGLRGVCVCVILRVPVEFALLPGGVFQGRVGAVQPGKVQFQA